MARFFISGGVVLVSIVALTLAVVDQPCNLSSDCSPGECCGLLSGGNEAFQGVCRTHLQSFQECDPDGPKDGHCGCMPRAFCVSLDGVHRCRFVMPWLAIKHS